MKSAAERDRYVTLRAEGLSIAVAAKRCKMAKDTAWRLEKSCAAAISDMRRVRLAELAEKYGMAKEARVKRLGETLSAIENALVEADLRTIPPEKLLGLKLKFTAALKEEEVRIIPPDAPRICAGQPYEVHRVLGSVIDRLRSGEITATQAQGEISACVATLKTYEQLETCSKLVELEQLFEERR